MATSLNAINLPALWRTRRRQANLWGAAFQQAALGRALPAGRAREELVLCTTGHFQPSLLGFEKNGGGIKITIVDCSWAKCGKARGQLAELSISFSTRSVGSSKTIHNSL